MRLCSSGYGLQPAALRRHIIEHKSALHKYRRGTNHLSNPTVDFAELHQQLAALHFTQAATAGRKHAAEKLSDYLRGRVPLAQDDIELALYCVDNSLHTGLREGEGEGSYFAIA